MGGYKPAPPAKMIAQVTLPQKACDYIKQGKVMDGLNPGLFQDPAMQHVAKLANKLSPSQKGLLLVGLKHALMAKHGAAVHFAEQEAGYELVGTGVEIKDDSGDENADPGPVRVFFATWSP